MKIPVWILTLLVGAAITVEGWTLDKIVSIGEDVAGIKATLAAQSNSPQTPGSSQSPKVAANNP